MINKIGDAGAAALAEALKVNGAMTTLLLCNNKIGDLGATALADGWMDGIMLLLEKLTLHPRMPSKGTGVGQVGNGSLELESLSLND